MGKNSDRSIHRFCRWP